MQRTSLLRAAAVAAAAVACGLVVVTAWLSLVGGAWVHRTGSMLLEVLILPAHLVWIVVGLLLALRLPRNAIGWLLLVVGLGYALVNLAINGVVYTHVVRGEPTVVTEILAVAGEGLTLLAIGVGWLGLFLVYPDGSLPSRRWRWVVWLAVATGVGYLALALVVRAPVYYMPTVDNPIGRVGGPALFHVAERGSWAVLAGVGLPAAVAALLLRWRRSGSVQRQQIKWLLLVAALLTLAMVLYLPVGLQPGAGELEHVFDVVIAIVSTAVPAAVLVAVTRYRLFEIDRIISRTVAYGVVAGMLVAVWATGVLAVQAVVPASGKLAVTGATLAAAALFNPVRRRVRRHVDRAFNRARYDAHRELEWYGDRLRDTVELDDVAADLLGVVARTLQPASSSVWLRQGVAEHGRSGR